MLTQSWELMLQRVLERMRELLEEKISILRFKRRCDSGISYS